jgi:dienelactone hydrolase
MRLMRFLRWAIVGVVLAAVGIIGRPWVHGLSFVIRVAEMQGMPRRIADLDTMGGHEREISIPTARGPLRARVYEPRSPHRAALLTSGLHPSGIDEPRLVGLARQLSAGGVTVVTPDVPELSRFEITSAITDTIERATGWLALESGLAMNRPVGMMGISFSGGLSIVAAGRPSLAGHVAYVFGFGGHDDLPRVLRYLCTGSEPYPAHELGVQSDRPFVLAPPEYGVAVILLGAADRVVPRPQVEPLRTAVRRYLAASALDSNVDKAAAAQEFDALKQLARTMPEPSATLLRYVNDRDVVHLGRRLLPYVGMSGGAPALSVSKSPKPSAPVFLLHGTEDNVIPPVESEYLARDLRGHAPVRLLLSGLIPHAEADRPTHVNDVMQLAGFWGDLLLR